MSRIDDAIDVFGGIVEKAPEVLAYRIAFAQFLTGLKRLDEAEEALKKAVAVFPEAEAANLAYVEFLASRRGVEPAIDALKTLIAKQPKTIKYQFALGKVYEAAQRLDDANTLYEEIAAAAEEGPDFLAARSRIALVAARQGDLDKASTIADEVLVENPRDPEALILRGTLRLNGGDAAGAIADFRTVMRDDPAKTNVIRLLARAHLANKEQELARDVLKRGIEGQPKSRHPQPRARQLVFQPQGIG